MITRGSKFFYGGAVVAYLTALFYGFLTAASAAGGVAAVFTDGGVVEAIVGPLSFGWKGGVGDHVGYSVLLGFAGVMAALGGFSTAFRDGSAEAVAQVEGRAHPRPVLLPAGLSYWPLLTAVGVALVVIGLAIDSLYFAIGCGVLVLAGLAWTVRAWAERATGDAAANRELRHTLVDPLEIPILVVIAAAIIILSVSRLLLAIPSGAATFVIIIVSIIFFVGALVLAGRPELKRSVLLGALLLGGVLLIGAGLAGAIAGEKEHGGGEEEGLGVPAVILSADSAGGADRVNTDGVGVATGD
jgi:hypothetical protein